MIILDSDVLSEAMRSDDKILSWLDRQPRTSVWTTTITVFEILYGLDAMPIGRRRTERQHAFKRLIDEKLQERVCPFDRSAAEAAAWLMAGRHRAGRLRETRDTMIAGIALAQNATLATRNTRHFDDLSTPVINPWQA
jgi:predicted nucleic acid-binding protein